MDATRTGTFIAGLRKEQGITQKQLAERLLVSDKAVSRWETGRGVPDIENLEALARELDVSVAELLRGERIEEPMEGPDVDAAALDGLALARELLRRRTVSNVLLGLLVGVALTLLVVVYLTSPIAIPWHEGLAHVEELGDGTLVAVAGEDVAGWDVETIGDEAFVSCHATRLHQLGWGSGDGVAVLGDASQVGAVLYYPGTPDDVLLHGKVDAAGVMTLPRLVYNGWLVIGIVASAVGLVAWALLRRRWYAGHILRAALLPLCLSVSLVAVLWGKFDRVYDASFYLSGICLVGLALWALCLLVLARRKG